jgi:hypothetical protein
MQVTPHLLPQMKGRANKFPRRENKMAMMLNLALVLGQKDMLR